MTDHFRMSRMTLQRSAQEESDQRRLEGCLRGDLLKDDLTYIGEGKHLTLEQNLWLGHSVTTQTAALLLREVLGFDVTVVETAMNWGSDDGDNPLRRLGTGQVDANLEGWALDWPTDLMRQYVEQAGTVERSTHEFQGRVGVYVPRYVVEDNPTSYPDYWRAYTNNQVLDLFRWKSNDTSLDALREQWAGNCDADAYDCVGAEWTPPRCQDNEYCVPFFHVYPEYAPGWVEQLIQNLGLNMTVFYAGWDLYEFIAQMQENRRPILFFSWRPHELLANDEFVRVTFPERNPSCEARDTDDRFGGRDCDHEGQPVYKLTTSTLKSRSKAAHEFIHKRFSMSLQDQYTMLAELEAGGHGGTLTAEQAACQWARDNHDKWSEWTSAVATDELPSCAEISFDEIEQFPVSQQQEIRLMCFTKSETVQDDNSITTILVGVLGAVVALAGVLAYLYVERRKRRGDSVWAVKTSDIKFDDPPVIAGRGTFGLVYLASYRGTRVAVKRVIPPKLDGKNSSNNKNRSTILGSGSIGTASMERNSDEERAPEMARDDVEAGLPNSSFQQSASMYKSGAIAKTNKYTASSSSENARMSTVARRKNRKNEYAKLKADFIDEMRHLSKLRHPSITTVIGAVIEKGEEPLLVMEYMDHGSLYDILHNETIPLDGDMLLPILRDICQGVRFLHSADPQVIHGDLKAANILVDRSFRAKVADFGLSAKKQVGATGTPAWMAPELLRGESPNTAASDVYSFGIILFEVYSRKDPYEGEDMELVLKEIADPNVNKRPPVPPACPSHLESLMKDCLDSDPHVRPTFEEIELRMKRMDADTVEPGLSPLAHYSRGAKNKQASEDLLYQVFPEKVAKALRDGRKVEPENKECVTIFFSDIVGFTDISGSLPPIKVQQMLDRLYTAFDELSHKHDVFKIETIGDAYVCVCNLVKDQDKDHVKRIAEFAVDAVQAASEIPIDLDDPSRGFVQIRVGFHSGPVIASVVGTRLPKYSMFGDTINVAARMESNSEPGRIQCSLHSAKLLRKQSASIPLLRRGSIKVKGKGNMETVWVNEGFIPRSQQQKQQQQKQPSARHIVVEDDTPSSKDLSAIPEAAYGGGSSNLLLPEGSRDNDNDSNDSSGNGRWERYSMTGSVD